jgi:Transposase DNA-binding
MSYGIGKGTTEEFIDSELSTLNLRDKRLVLRAKRILSALQRNLTSCIKRLFIDECELEQAYDFFFQQKSI